MRIESGENLVKRISIAALIAASLALGGCFQTVLDAYDVSARYPADQTARNCPKAADCQPDGGGGGN
jgi:hypothetical protein